MNKINLNRELVNYTFITIGSFLLALGIVGFLAPNKIATGGTAGLAIIFHYVLDMPTGLLMALINIPLLILGLKFLGKKFAYRSTTCILLIVVFVDVLDNFVQLPILSNDLLLATLYGGVSVGLGLGFIFKGGGSAGGGTILAKIIVSKFDVKTGTVVLVLDAIVVCSAGLVFNSLELALWSLISIFAASKLIDTILTGRQNQKIVHISSLKSLDALSKNITESLGVSGTIVSGNDLDISEQKDIIFIVVEKNRINALKNLVQHYDSSARMIVMEATEMLGENNRK